MADFPFDVVAFDLDGTLADTLSDITAALNRTLDDVGRPAIDARAVRALIGGGSRALLRRALGEADETLIDRAQALYLDHYSARICVDTRPYPGVENGLAALAARGVRLAVCTNKAERLTDALVAALGWQGLFAGIVCADTLGVRKPDPAALFAAVERAGGGRAVLVGDSIIDAETARAAGVPFVAVSFGFSDRPVDQLGADAVIDSYAGLVDALERLEG